MIDTIIQGDCLEVMKQIPSGSVDMILCDLPYGTTACSWDVVIPFEPLWEQYKRVIKRNGAIVLTGSEPFSSYLRLSNIGWYKYDWIWDKISVSNPQLSNIQPLKTFENVSVFGEGKIPYYPQGLEKRVNPDKRRSKSNSGEKLGHNARKEYSSDMTNYPKMLSLRFPREFNNDTVHPTQKPVDLFAYLIRTYTNEGELVLDNCIGSGTTAVACVQTGRHYIGIEQSEEYCNIARRRVAQAVQQLTLL